MLPVMYALIVAINGLVCFSVQIVFVTLVLWKIAAYYANLLFMSFLSL